MNLNLNYLEIESAINGLKDSATRIDLQCDILEEVCKLWESSWLDACSVEYCAIARNVERKLRENGRNFKSGANNLNITLEAAKAAENRNIANVTGFHGVGSR